MNHATLNPYDILRLCHIPKYPRAFALPTKERPSRVFSQQRRALNIAHALLETDMVRTRGVIIVGGGFGGLTLGAFIAMQGIQVEVFEREDEVLKRFKCSKRYLHPRMYDWPNEGWDQQAAGLPCLDWTANSAANVRKSIAAQVRALERFFPFKLTLKATVHKLLADPSGAGVLFSETGDQSEAEKGKLKNAEAKVRSADVVICATGFGEEKTLEGYPPGLFPSYWKSVPDPETIPMKANWTDAGATLHVLGNGDGALADLVGIFAESGSEGQMIRNGNFTSLLKKLEQHRAKVLELEALWSDAMVIGASTLKSYGECLNDIFGPIASEESEMWPIVKMEGKSIEWADVAGTYAANRVLFYQHVVRRHRFDYSCRQDVRKIIPHGSLNGRIPSQSTRQPFINIGDNPPSWLLYRAGPEDSMKDHLKDTKIALRAADNLRRLELTERPISRGAWSRQVIWGPERLQWGPSLPKLALATEWADSFVQLAVSEASEPSERDAVNKQVVDFLRGLFRLYTLIYDEIVIPDASVLDGRFLHEVVQDRVIKASGCLRILARERNTAGDPCLVAAFWAFMLKLQARKWVDKGVYLSSIGDSVPKACMDYLTSLNLAPSHNCNDTFNSLITHFRSSTPQPLAAGPGNFLDIVRRNLSLNLQADTFPMPVALRGLRVFDPPTGLLNELAEFVNSSGSTAGDSQEAVRVFPLNRSTAFQRLVKLLGPKFPNIQRLSDLLLEQQPIWLPLLVGWYNSAYNSSIAYRNGANVIETLWTDPAESIKSSDRPVCKVDILNLAGHSADEWHSLAGLVRPSITKWRQGRITLVEALTQSGLASLQVASASAPMTGNSRNSAFRERLNAMRQSAWCLTISESYNKADTIDTLAPRRALRMACGNMQIATTLIYP